MRTRIRPALLLAAVLLLAVGCDSGNPTPTPVAPYTPEPFDPFPSPPAVISAPTRQVQVTLEKAEAASLFPVRLLNREKIPGTPRFGAAPGTPVPDIRFSLEFINNTGHEVENFVGVLLIQEKSGNTLGSYRFAYKDTGQTKEKIAPGAHANGTLYVHDSPYIESNQILESTPLSNIDLEFRATFINYTVGPQQEILINPGSQ